MTHLHLALQNHYAGDDGLLEAIVDGYRVDVLRGGVVYEIQTGRFRSIRAKLEALTANRPLVLVHPIMRTRTIVRIDPTTGEILGERRSPKRGAWHEAFRELMAIANLFERERFTLDVLLTDERETRADTGRGSWRRKGVERVQRELVAVAETRRISAPADLWNLLPAGLPSPFTTEDLSQTLRVSAFHARHVAYTLRQCGAATLVGKRSRRCLYERP